MSSSRIPGPLSPTGPWAWFRTPSSLGYNDQGDPRVCTRLGDSPGPLGFQDLGDPRLSVLVPGDRLIGGGLGGSQDGIPLALASSQTVPEVAGKITKEQLKKIFASASDDYLQQVADELNTDPVEYGLDTVLRRSHFFAQVRQEGGAALEAKVESLQYSPDGLKGTFKYYRLHPTEVVTDGYEGTRRPARSRAARTRRRSATTSTRAATATATSRAATAGTSGDGGSSRSRAAATTRG